MFDEDDELCWSNIEPIALELMFSENYKVSKLAAQYFVDHIINTQPNEFEQIKVILLILGGIPSQLITTALSYFVEAIYELFPLLGDFNIISQVLNLENFIEDKDKCNLMILMMYVVKWSVTGIKPEHKFAISGDQDDVSLIKYSCYYFILCSLLYKLQVFKKLYTF